MPRYLVEAYVAGGRAGEARAACRDARAAAEELVGEGTPIRYMRMTFLPDDETCFKSTIPTSDHSRNRPMSASCSDRSRLAIFLDEIEIELAARRSSTRNGHFTIETDQPHAKVAWRRTLFDPMKGVSRAYSSLDHSRDRPAASRGAGGACPCGDPFARGSQGALEHNETQRAAQWLLARPAPAPQERDGAGTGPRWNQLSVVESGTCRRARRTLSVVLDGEASATELAETDRHLRGCAECTRFAVVVTELRHCLRAASPERPKALSGMKRPKGERS